MMNFKYVYLVMAILALFSSKANAQVCKDIMAGQHEVAGQVCVDVEEGNLVVTYETTNGWDLGEYHLYVGEYLKDMPQTKKGSPKNGKFPYKGVGGNGQAIIVITAEELGREDLCKFDEMVIAAHCVVSKDTNGDGVADRTETGWAGDRELPGKNWALHFGFVLCPEYYFDNTGLQDSLGSDEIKIKAKYNGGNASKSYLTSQIDFEEDGVYDIVGLDTYCIDLNNNIRSNKEYCARIVSSYSDLSALPAVVHPENMDLVNYVLNNFTIGEEMPDGEILTGGSIQKAMWTLAFTDGTDPGNHGQGSTSQAHVDLIVALASALGEGFEPDCDGYVGVILYPVGCGTVDVAAQVVVAQVLVSKFPAACKKRCVVCPSSFDD